MTYRPLLTLAALPLLITTPALADTYDINYSQSTIHFTGNQAGEDFTGHFDSWHAEIDFNPNDLQNSHITAQFDTASATTGKKMLDSAIPKADWFNVKEFPHATFTSTQITALGDNQYQMYGALTIRGVTHTVKIPFALSDLNTTPVTAKASFTIDRTAYGMGMDSDPSGEWVDKDIHITFDLTASKHTSP